MMAAIASGLAFVLLAATLLPLSTIPHGFVRSLDFPRLQFAILALACLCVLAVTGQANALHVTAAIAALLVVAVQGFHIARFTPLWTPSSRSVGDQKVIEEFTLVSANVKQSNTRFADLARIIERADPDIAILMEVNRDWVDGLAPIIAQYPHTLLEPKDNSYGMVLLSKHRLEKSDILYLLKDDVPSFDCVLRLKSNKRMRLVCLHPEPPVPHDDTVGRDAEICLAAQRISKETLPVVVAGDLNDVAWSPTTRRFLRLSGLLDPRQGRGFFSTFDARFAFARWPLDHVFHSGQFRFIDMRRLDYFGSDHFPIFCKLGLVENGSTPAEESDPNGDDLKEARDLIAEEKSSDKPARGQDWE